MVVAFVDDHRERFGVESICRVLTEHGIKIAPNGYRAHKLRVPSTRAVRDERVLNEIVRVHTDPKLGRGLYGVLKVHAQLLREGGVDAAPVSRRQVERLMRTAGLQGARRGRAFRSTRPDSSAPRPPDLVQRRFSASEPNRLWADPRIGDAANVEDVAALSAGQDIVISATRPAPGSETELVTTSKALLAGLAGTGVRLLLVGGAATLTMPGTGGTTVVEDPNFPADLRDLAIACRDQLETCRAETAVDWAYLSPPAQLEPGQRTGTYRLGTDELLADPEGNSTISMEDFAVALLDEAEQPKHHQTRFTVAY